MAPGALIYIGELAIDAVPVGVRVNAYERKPGANSDLFIGTTIIRK